MTLGLTWSPFPLDLDSSWWYQNAMRQNKPREGATRETYDGKMLQQWIPLVAYMPTTNYTLLPLSLSLSLGLSLLLLSFPLPCTEFPLQSHLQGSLPGVPRACSSHPNPHLQPADTTKGGRCPKPPSTKKQTPGGWSRCRTLPWTFHHRLITDTSDRLIALKRLCFVLGRQEQDPSRSHCEMLGGEGGR